jgi:hypothetical protein
MALATLADSDTCAGEVEGGKGAEDGDGGGAAVERRVQRLHVNDGVVGAENGGGGVGERGEAGGERRGGLGRGVELRVVEPPWTGIGVVTSLYTERTQ